MPAPIPDDAVAAVLMLLFIGAAATHMTIFQRNKRRNYKFIPSLFLFVFCMARIAALVFRIIWASYPTNPNIAIVSGVLTAAGTLILFLINLIFAQRILRAYHPSFGWHRAVTIVFRFGFFSVIALLIMLIITSVHSYFTLNPTTRQQERNVQLFAATYLAILAALPMPIAALSFLIPRKYESVDCFGTGRMRTKVYLLFASSFLMATGAIFRVAANFHPRPMADPAWYHHKAAFYCFNFVIEMLAAYLYAISRVDQRFYIPNGAWGPGSYSKLQAHQTGDLEGVDVPRISTEPTEKEKMVQAEREQHEARRQQSMLTLRPDTIGTMGIEKIIPGVELDLDDNNNKTDASAPPRVDPSMEIPGAAEAREARIKAEIAVKAAIEATAKAAAAEAIVEAAWKWSWMYRPETMTSVMRNDSTRTAIDPELAAAALRDRQSLVRSLVQDRPGTFLPVTRDWVIQGPYMTDSRRNTHQSALDTTLGADGDNGWPSSDKEVVIPNSPPPHTAALANIPVANPTADSGNRTIWRPSTEDKETTVSLPVAESEASSTAASGWPRDKKHKYMEEVHANTGGLPPTDHYHHQWQQQQSVHHHSRHGSMREYDSRTEVDTQAGDNDMINDWPLPVAGGHGRSVSMSAASSAGGNNGGARRPSVRSGPGGLREKASGERKLV